MDAVLQLKRFLCSFAASWEALHILFEVKQLAECRSRNADKLVVLAERKPRPADKLEEFAEHKPRPAGKLITLAERKPRPAGNSFEEFAECKPRPASKLMVFSECKQRMPRPVGELYWELSVVAIDFSAKDSSSDFYRGIAHIGNCQSQQ